jgi:ferredoxin
MTYVITEPCIGVTEKSCIEVCPVDCIYSDDASQQYVINPAECIDCGACVSECPVEAIYAEDDLPDDQRRFVQINAEHFA